MEPIRKYCKRTNTPTQYYEAMAMDIDFENQKVLCKDVNHVSNNEVTTFELPYDHLVVSVGAINNHLQQIDLDQFGDPAAQLQAAPS